MRRASRAVDASCHAPTNVQPENSLTASLEQPSLIGGRTTGFFSTSYNIYPLLYPLASDNPEDEPVLGYNEIALRTGLDQPFLSGRLPVTLSVNW